LEKKNYLSSISVHNDGSLPQKRHAPISGHAPVAPGVGVSSTISTLNKLENQLLLMHSGSSWAKKQRIDMVGNHGANAMNDNMFMGLCSAGGNPLLPNMVNMGSFINDHQAAAVERTWRIPTQNPPKPAWPLPPDQQVCLGTFATSSTEASVRPPSGFFGVHACGAGSGRWLAALKCRGKRLCLGIFDTKEQAAFAYDREVTTHRSSGCCPMSRTNFGSLQAAEQAASRAEAEYTLLNMGQLLDVCQKTSFKSSFGLNTMEPKVRQILAGGPTAEM
jgi:hypothetical protein